MYPPPLTTQSHNDLGMSPQRKDAKPRGQRAGSVVFYPLATGYALVALPASVLAMLGTGSPLPALAIPSGHAHEMLFGFALAVVAGNQLGALPASRLALLVALWAIARATFVLAPLSMAAAASNIAFAGLLAARLAPRLLRSAKKPRNKALPAALIAICACGIALQVAPHVGLVAAVPRTLLAAVLSFALLMLFMGGRLIAPAVAGQFYRQGDNLDARVQPRIEAALVVSMAIAIAVSVSASPPLGAVGAAAMIASGVLATARLLRWRLWALRGRPDLLCLAAGYAWLAVGLLLLGATRTFDGNQIAALHVITVGSIGTLTLNVMAMTWMQKARQDPARSRVPVWGTLLIALATLLRVGASLGAGAAAPLLASSALCWSAAFALLLGLLVRARPRPRRAEPIGP